jgi:hypothetical protein
LFEAKQADIGSIQVETKGNQAGTQEKNYHRESKKLLKMALKDRSKGRAIYLGLMGWI